LRFNTVKSSTTVEDFFMLKTEFLKTTIVKESNINITEIFRVVENTNP